MVMFMTISPTEDMNGVCTASVLLGWLGAGMGEGGRGGGMGANSNTLCVYRNH